MNNYNKYAGLIMLLLSFSVFGKAITDNRSYWNCQTQDDSGKIWTAKSNYQKVALNIAFAACKKESIAPVTCKKSKANCEGFYQGTQTKEAMWQCTAIDHTARPWRSNLYSRRDDAALAAKAHCKKHSELAETCYINLITCVHINEKE